MSEMNVEKALCCCLLALCVFSVNLHADTVVLKSGVRYNDVKAEPIAQFHRIRFSDGRVEVLPNSIIRSVRPGATSWSQVYIPVVPQKIPDPVVPRPEIPLNPVKVPAFVLTPTMKSVVFPGWGQYAEQRRITGAVYAAAGVLALERYWYFRQKHAAAERQYNDPIPVGIVASQSLTGSLSLVDAALINFVYLAGQEKKVYKLQNQGNSMIMAYGLVWAWNLFDIRAGGLPWERGWVGSARPVAHGTRPILYLQKDGLGVMVRIPL
ncbi:MAG: hypothetical protein K8S54_05310 [Spirochaetia bacterium]|nr:hypothetical protein [Spirochaetia bacterium]